MIKSNSKINTIIIEDNIESQEYLTSILQSQFSNIDIIGYADNVIDSISIINTEKPELIFMDIELIDGYSFEIFKHLKHHDFEVIFVTAFDNYMSKAIDHYAFSYIIKPYEKDRMIKVINRYIHLKERLFSEHKFQLLSSFLSSKSSRFLLHVGNEHVSININDIIKCEAEGNYTYFYLADHKKYLASNSLKYYEELLIDKGFFKAHRSVLINIEYIASIYKKETIILTNNDKINVSVRNKSNLTDLINQLS
ncbi:LytTR family DNA-binding domain-containing protein [uncultured Psychroserpens sp.]|uniref:LytR/AlgR family response regulator transcription factor n=1 Tax=uncultured Psychroserpens sp. TaxID=255436 RepID=UPI00260376CE|nr:LytTR family DNA-binding domain-containing protein [uncultured Psychroserpens sp.]